MRLRLPLISLFVVALASLAPLPVHAQGAQYTTVVPVPDTSDAQRDQAFSVALTQVLAKVAGHDLSTQPDYDDVIGKASSYVQQYQYQKEGNGPNAGFMLQVSFDPSSIHSLVRQLGASAWSGSRPPVLLLVQGPGGHYLGADQLDVLTQQAGARGVTFVYPRPGAMPDAQALAQGDPQALAGLADTYHTGQVLLGSLQGNRADWTLVAGGAPQHWQDQAAGTAALLSDAGQALVTRLNQIFGDHSPGVESTGTLWVDGLESADDLARVLAGLRGDARVQSVTPERADGHGVLLQVHARVPMSTLASDLVAQGTMVSDNSAHGGADASVRWVH